MEYFRTFYGPMQKAFEALDTEGQTSLRNDMMALIKRFDISTNDSLCISSEYAEIIVERR